MSLEQYRRKRDFEITPEPSGRSEGEASRTPPSTDEPRFVVQRHRARRLHYDFRLEIDGVLASWAVPKGPTLDPSARRGAFHVEDHPMEYFDFEGTIPGGQYGAGDVIVWDWGHFRPEGTTDPAAAVRAGELKFELFGEKLRGRFTIVRTRGRADASGNRAESDDWLLIKKRDAPAVPGWDPEAYPRSVKTGRTNDEVAANAPAVWDGRAPAAEAEIDLSAAREAPMPDFIEPMSATLGDRPFDDPEWLFELKWDGYRVQAHVRDGKAAFFTRRGNDAAHYFPELARPVAWIGARQAILDGEVVALNAAGEPEFHLLQARVGPGGSRRRGADPGEGTLAYEVFDLLYLDGRLLLEVPLEERKRLLRAVLRDDPTVRYAGHVVGDGVAFYEAVAGRGLEGIVAKLRRSRYEAGRRSPAWLKLKRRAEQEVVIAGWLPREGSETDLGSLVAGVYDGDDLLPAGRVGTGFDARERAALLKRLRPLERDGSPFRSPPRLPGVRWVKPTLVARVEFAEWTSDGLLRAASYKGLDLDHDPRTVSRERATSTAKDRRRAEAESPPPKAAKPKAAGPKAAEPAKPTEPKAAEAAKPTEPKAAEPAKPTEPKASAVSRPDAVSQRVEPAPRKRQAAPEPSPVAGPPERARPEELAALDALPGSGGRWIVGGHELRLTNLDKVLWPADGYTKRDLIRYYTWIAPYALPYLRDRGLTVYRRPNGIDKPGFWQKQIPGHAPDWVQTWSVEHASADGPRDYVVADRVATLAWLANEAAIDLHPWTSRIEAPDRPTWALIDIDPGERTTWDEVVTLAHLYRAALEHVRVTGFPKVSGQRGIQVWIPIRPVYTFEQTRDWVAAISRAVGSAVPQLVSWEWEKSRRGGLARLDYTQNAANKTLVAPYAVRPVPGAAVSAPIDWAELDDRDLQPNRWTIRSVQERLRERGDLFAPSLTMGQELPAL